MFVAICASLIQAPKTFSPKNYIRKRVNVYLLRKRRGNLVSVGMLWCWCCGCGVLSFLKI